MWTLGPSERRRKRAKRNHPYWNHPLEIHRCPGTGSWFPGLVCRIQETPFRPGARGAGKGHGGAARIAGSAGHGLDTPPLPPSPGQSGRSLPVPGTGGRNAPQRLPRRRPGAGSRSGAGPGSVPGVPVLRKSPVAASAGWTNSGRWWGFRSQACRLARRGRTGSGVAISAVALAALDDLVDGGPHAPRVPEPEQAGPPHHEDRPPAVVIGMDEAVGQGLPDGLMHRGILLVFVPLEQEGHLEVSRQLEVDPPVEVLKVARPEPVRHQAVQVPEFLRIRREFPVIQGVVGEFLLDKPVAPKHQESGHGEPLHRSLPAPGLPADALEEVLVGLQSDNVVRHLSPRRIESSGAQEAWPQITLFLTEGFNRKCLLPNRRTWFVELKTLKARDKMKCQFMGCSCTICVSYLSMSNILLR